MKTNKVFICGAGPGDPELITVKAMKLLRSCDVVFYDRLVSKEIIDQIPSKSETIFVGRSVGDAASDQDYTNKLMVVHAKNGKSVLRLKGGDPFIFGRGAEEAEYLFKNNVKFEIVPGITSAIGSAAYAGIPLTHRRFASSVAIVTGHEDPSKKEPNVNWNELAFAVDTLVILMGVEQLSRIVSNLIKSGMKKSTEVAIIENGTTRKQREITGNLGNIVRKARTSKMKAPAVIIFGKVVSLHKKLAWLDRS
ncbi:MAG TPA: uroporphyrinogen-III C-methyltransferase [Candidatus Nitrosopolaris sp.]|nr:uroporphyrinogen-III C-methyltransferase [Candidatus Nitrosopolaris sp.]